MGCDGGTIPRRDELVRTKKKPEQKDKMADLVAKWKHCAISQETLRTPVMGCELGKLYNKESVLEFLLDRNKFECAHNFKHLRGLKDLKELNLTVNPSETRKQAEKGDAYIDSLTANYICPVVGVEMNGMFRFCFVWRCGCVMSERALKEIKLDICHKCGQKTKADDIVLINGTEEDIQLMTERMNKRREAAKLEKKAKKAEKKKSDIPTSEDAGCSGSKLPCLSNGISVNGSGKSKLINGSKKCDSTNTSTAVASGSGTSSSMKTLSKEKTLTALQKDPKSSNVYKSLFTSSEECKKKPEQHWITYNPLYF